MTDEEAKKAFDEFFAKSVFDKITVENGVISCTGDVRLRYSHKEKAKLPLSFDRVDGDFHVNNAQLRSLDGSPKLVKRHFYCHHNLLTDLQGAPEIIEGDMNCSTNYELTSLVGSPKLIHGSFFCENNVRLHSLLGCPMVIGGDFIAINTSFDTWRDAPRFVGGRLILDYHEDTHLLGILTIKGIKKVIFVDINEYTENVYIPIETALSDILSRYIGQGRPGMLPCANEMLKVGYGSNARL